jgi:hypothetical protein
MSLFCEECLQEINEEPHRCLASLIELMDQIETKQIYQNHHIKRIQETADQIINYIPLYDKIQLFDEIVHDTYGCDGCSAYPIKGLRFKCRDCVNFDFCAMCREKSGHQHTDFYLITASGSHEGIGCDGCGEANIKSLRYRCIECRNFNLCHKCYLTEQHEHDSFVALLPVVMTVDAFPNKHNLSYSIGEEVIIHFSVMNLSITTIRSLSLRRISGTFPFPFEEKKYELNLRVGEKSLLVYKTHISEEQGSYAGVCQFYYDEYKEAIGPPIVMNFSVYRARL